MMESKNKQTIHILIDNGHGSDTKGKCSPDRMLLEYAWTREVAAYVVHDLKACGYNASLVTPEANDISIAERVRRVNKVCDTYGAKNCICVSIHCNAAGADNQWHEAHGWSVFVSANKAGKVSDGSAMLSSCFVEAARDCGRKVRHPLPSQPYWVKSLGMTRDTKCPAVLTENFFMDNREDCDFLLSEMGKSVCIDIHTTAIMRYIEML